MLARGTPSVGSQTKRQTFQSIRLFGKLDIRSSWIFKVRVWRMLLSFLSGSVHLAKPRWEPQDHEPVSRGSNSKQLFHGWLVAIDTFRPLRCLGYMSLARKQPSELVRLAGFHTRKWMLNWVWILEDIATEDHAWPIILQENSLQTTKASGLLLMPKRRQFLVKLFKQTWSTPSNSVWSRALPYTVS